MPKVELNHLAFSARAPALPGRTTGRSRPIITHRRRTTEMKCPSCGIWNRAHFTKCFRCGADLPPASEADAGAPVFGKAVPPAPQEEPDEPMTAPAEGLPPAEGPLPAAL